MHNIAGTTYIGKRVPHYFLGGGKSSQGESFWYHIKPSRNSNTF
jgi:hypothetical protein